MCCCLNANYLIIIFGFVQLATWKHHMHMHIDVYILLHSNILLVRVYYIRGLEKTLSGLLG